MEKYFEEKSDYEKGQEDNLVDIFADRLVDIFIQQIQSQKKSSNKNNKLKKIDERE